MRSFKKAMYFCVFLIAFSFAGCNSTADKNQMPVSKPMDFNFVFNYGVGARNQLDTIKGKFTKDMIIDPSITTDLKLSEDEMNTIYSEMKRINILGYPENFKPKNNVYRTPHSTYFIKIIADGKEKSLSWEDENVSEAKEAVQLRNLFEKIQEMIVNKEEFKKLPEAKGGYD